MEEIIDIKKLNDLGVLMIKLTFLIVLGFECYKFISFIVQG